MVALQNTKLDLNEVLGLTDATTERELSRKLITFYTAQGMPRELLCEKLQVTSQVVDIVLKSREGAAEIIRLQGLMFPNVHDRVRRLSHIALDKQSEILLRSEDDKLIAQVSEKMLDRGLGKATQVIESRNFHFEAGDIKQVESAIDQQINRIAKLEEMSKKLETASKDIIDAK